MAMHDQQQAPQTPGSAGTMAEESGNASHDNGATQTSANASGAAGAGEGTEEHVALHEELEQYRQQSAEYLQQLQRLQAEFQNYRRRVTQEKQQAVNRGKEDVLQALLPILANLNLAVQHAEQDANAVRQGVQMIWQQFETFLRDQGLERIATVGEIFNPARHDVLSVVPATAETPANIVVSEVKPGYFLDGRLLCPAQVVVAQAADAAAAPTA